MVLQFTTPKNVKKPMASVLAILVSNIPVPIPTVLASIPLSMTIPPTISPSILIPSDSSGLNKDKSTDSINKKAPKSSNIKKLYAQASRTNSLSNVKNILHIKDVFFTLSAKKVAEIINITNKNMGVKKPKINMTTKEPSRKQNHYSND